MSTSKRIWKYRTHYLIVIPALILILVHKFLPFVHTLIGSFKKFTVPQGFYASPFIGLQNYELLWTDERFLGALQNTFTIKLSYLAASGLLSLILAISLSLIGRRLWRGLFSSIFLLPFFIPSMLLVFVTFTLLSPTYSPFAIASLPLGNPAYIKPIIVAIELFQTCGIPVLIALAAITVTQSTLQDTRDESFMRTTFFPALRAVCAFMLLQLSGVLTMDKEIVYSILNAMVMEAGQTVDHLAFQYGYQLFRVGVESALQISVLVIQLLFAFPAYILLRRYLVKDLFHPAADPIEPQRSGRAGVVGYVVGAVYTGIVLFMLYYGFIDPWVIPSEAGLSVWDVMSVGSYVLYLIVTIVSVLIFMFITLTLAYPLTVRNLPGRRLYKGYLIFILLLGSGSIAEFMLMRDLGMVNTFLPYLIHGVFALVAVFVLKSIFNRKYGHLKEQASKEGKGELLTFFTLFIPKVWKPLIGLGVLQFVFIWNAYFPSLIYTGSTIGTTSPMLEVYRFYASHQAPSDSVLMRAGVIASLPSVILFIVFRKFLTSEVFVGQTRG